MQRMGHLKEQGGCLEVADAVECQFVVLSVSAVAVGSSVLTLFINALKILFQKRHSRAYTMLFCSFCSFSNNYSIVDATN